MLNTIVILLYCGILTAFSYKIGSQRTSYSAAEDYCLSIGSSLASIHSASDNSAAQSLCSNTDVNSNNYISDGCWIGLNDLTTAGTYVYQDGSTTDYGFSGGSPTGSDPWQSGEPNNYNNEQCIHMADVFNFNWNDITCGASNYPICNSMFYFIYPNIITLLYL